MSRASKVIILVGSPGSGKDALIRAVRDLGAQHAQIVPKHTDRGRRADDGQEMICVGDKGYDLEACDITYENYGSNYGIQSKLIWSGLRKGSSQVCVVSNVDAINRLREVFGDALSLVYVHSDMQADQYEKNASENDEYVKRRKERYEAAVQIYIKHLLAFDHVLIASGPPEDLYDQIFRLFRAYER